MNLKRQEDGYPPPDFNSIEELRAYYNAEPLEKVLDRINQLFG